MQKFPVSFSKVEIDNLLLAIEAVSGVPSTNQIIELFWHAGCLLNDIGDIDLLESVPETAAANLGTAIDTYQALTFTAVPTAAEKADAWTAYANILAAALTYLRVPGV